MRGRENALFADGDLHAALDIKRKQAIQAIGELPAGRIHASSDEQLVAQFLDKFTVSPVTLYPDQIARSMTECQFETRDRFTYDIRDGESIKVPGVKVTVQLPYSGDPGLFKLRPSTMLMTTKHAVVSRPDTNGVGMLTFELSFNQHQLSPEKIQSEIDSAIRFTTETIGYQNPQLAQFEVELARALQIAVARSLGGRREVPDCG